MNGPNSPDDDRIDEMLIHAARDYNRPSEVPREEIWAKISEARRANAATIPGTTRVQRPTRRVWLGPSIGIAAAVLISTGIMIGRRMNTTAPTTTQSPASRSPATVATTSTPDRGDASGSKGGSASAAPSAGASTAHDTLQEQLHQETRRTNDAVRALAAAAADRAAAPETGIDAQRSRNLAYQLVVMRHLAGTEAMITSFQQSARRGSRDSTMSEWSRELLGTTRSLEASRATSDPVMRRLLDDLDLVLSQIVQYTTKGTYDPDELDLIDQSIHQRGVMTKLRSTLPARQMPAGT